MNLSGLDNFANKVKRYSKLGNLDEIIAEKIANRGVEIATEQYAGRKNTTIKSVVGETKNKRQVVAQGKGINFDEFGTGLVGKGTYEGKLPTETITFESPKGEPQQTQGWEYYYDNPKTKVNGGWYAGKVFHRGQPAKAQMFNTSKQLKNEIRETAKNTIKEMIK